MSENDKCSSCTHDLRGIRIFCAGFSHMGRTSNVSMTYIDVAPVLSVAKSEFVPDPRYIGNYHTIEFPQNIISEARSICLIKRVIPGRSIMLTV